MPRRQAGQPDRGSVLKTFASPEEIDRAIRKLERRVKQVESLADATFGDPRVENAERDISSDVLDIYGPLSPEFRDYEHHRIWHGGLNLYDTDEDRTEKIRAGVPYTLEILRGLIARLAEARQDFEADAAGRSRATFESVDLHPRIRSVAEELFRDGHYRNAVVDAAIALTNYVKERSGRHDLDGTPLMSEVLSKKAPILAFNGLADQTDLDEQEGLMHLFMGASLAIRNPRSHDVRMDDPDRAIEYLMTLSLLAHRLDGARRVAQPPTRST